MKQIRLFLIFFILFSNWISKANAQAVMWQRFYPYNQSNAIADVIQTFDGGYIMAGGISVPPLVKILLIKINYLGAVEWEKIIDDSSNNISVLSIKQTSDSGYVMSGQRNLDCYILKTDNKGNYLWRKSYNINEGDARPNDIVITNDQGFIFSADIFYVFNGSSRSYVVKTDSFGNTQWEKLYGDSVLTSGTYILQTLCNEYFMTNNTRRDLSTPYLGMIYKLNFDGGINWKKRIGLNKAGVPILIRKNDGIFLVGQNMTNTLNLIKFDTSGNLIWYNTFNIPLALQNVCINSNYDFIFGGYQEINSQYDYAIAKIDIDGNFIENKIIETPKSSDDFCSKIRYTNDGGYIFVGNTNYGRSLGIGNNVLAVKTDSAFNTSPIVNVTPTSELSPEEFKLYQNYPNPFNPITKISFELPQNGKVKLVVYDMLGREVMRLLNDEFKRAGSYVLDFNGTNLSSGIYFYRLVVENNFVETKRMILVK